MNIEHYGTNAKLACQNTAEYQKAKKEFIVSTCKKEAETRESGSAWLISSLTDKEMNNFFTCPPVAKQSHVVNAECSENSIMIDTHNIGNDVIHTCLELDYPTTGEYLATITCSTSESFCEPYSSEYCYTV